MSRDHYSILLAANICIFVTHLKRRAGNYLCLSAQFLDVGNLMSTFGELYFLGKMIQVM